MIRVLTVADSFVVRAGLQAMVRGDRRFHPLDTQLGVMGLPRLVLSDLEAAVVLVQLAESQRLPALTHPSQTAAPLVVLAEDMSRKELLRVLDMGVRAVLRCDAPPVQLLAAIEAAAAGLACIDPDHLPWLLRSTGRFENEEEFELDPLSGREIEVLALMAQGLANKNIADRLRISEHTVKFHVSSILSKLRAASRTEAVMKGLRDGMVVL
jgi:DNA-binding NarL/FixJ family response regulator